MTNVNGLHPPISDKKILKGFPYMGLCKMKIVNKQRLFETPSIKHKTFF